MATSVLVYAGRKRNKVSRKKRKTLEKAIRERCTVEITTSDQEEDYMDVDLRIGFLDGSLKGMVYVIHIDIEDYHEVGW